MKKGHEEAMTQCIKANTMIDRHRGKVGPPYMTYAQFWVLQTPSVPRRKLQ